MSVSMMACGAKSDSKQENTATTKEVDSMSFDELKKEAKGSTVTFYGWGGDDKLNDWLDNSFAPIMKEKYDITMERVPMDIDQILSQLSGELGDKNASEDNGDIDIIWINGENFQI